MKKNVLVVNDESLTRNLMRRILEKDGYTVFEAGNGVEALSILDKGESIPIVITDLNMPEMNGQTLIDHLIDRPKTPIILVHSAISETGEIIDIIKKGVVDFIPKPLIPEEMLLRINKSIQFANLQEIQEQLIKEKNERTAMQLDWNRWKFQALKNSSEKDDNAVIESLRTSFSQGIGFGSLIPTIQLLKKKAKVSEDGKTATVPYAMLELLYDNMEAGKKLIETFELLEKISGGKRNAEYINLTNLTNVIINTSDKLKEYLAMKNLNFSMYKTKPKFSETYFQVEISYFEMAIEELIINAIKFSEPLTSIYVLCVIENEYCKISFLNDPIKETNYEVGIPKEYSELVFEPLFRLSKLVHEFIPTRDYGLGLTIVDKVMRRNSGSVEAYNIQSHLGVDQGKTLTNVTISLPIITLPTSN